MKFLQLFPSYSEYLLDFSVRHPGLADLPYAKQNALLRDDGFGIVHMFARYLGARGYETELVFTECEAAQKKWLAEQGGTLANPDDWRLEIAARQVDDARPEILYITEPVYYDRKFLTRLQHRPRLVLGWKAAATPPGTDWHGFDAILSNFQLTFDVGPGLGASRVEHITPGFPETLADELPAEPKTWDVSFLGSVSSEHGKRNEYLNGLARSQLVRENDFSLGYFLRTAEPAIVPVGIALHNRGPVWGAAMHRILKGSRIGLNIGIDLAKDQTGNMRMIEVTGLGTFLLTEHKSNIASYFEPGVECDTFRSPGELDEKIAHYLKNPDARERLAAAGRARCRHDFSMTRSLDRLEEIIQALLKS